MTKSRSESFGVDQEGASLRSANQQQEPGPTHPVPLQAGRELDALIAEKVMGLVRCQGSNHDSSWSNEFCYANPDTPAQGAEVRGYSTSVADAWEVVEKLLALTWEYELGYRRETRQHYAMFMLSDSVGDWPLVDAPTLSEAICRAALLAVESEK